MKTIQKLSIVIAGISMMNFQLLAQNSNIDFKGLTIGKYYQVIISNGWKAEGKLTGMDSNSISVNTQYKIIKIPKSDVERIEAITLPTQENKYSDLNENYDRNGIKNKLYLSLGSGVSFTSIGFYEGYSPGLNIQFDITKLISSGYAIRGDFQFGQNPKKNHDYDYGEYGYSNSKGGDINNYSLKFDFLLGALKPSSTINGYGILGGGFNLIYESEEVNTYSYQEYNYSTMEYTTHTNTYTSKSNSIGEMVLEFGGGIGFKISDKLRLFGEAQYGFPILFLGQYTGFYPESFLYGNPTLKIGAQIGL